MERLTEKIKNIISGETLAYTLKSPSTRIKALNKLGKYEDAEEKGVLHIAAIPDGTPIYVWQKDEDDCWFVHNESYKYGVSEYMYGELGKDFFVSEEECKNHPQ